MTSSWTAKLFSVFLLLAPFAAHAQGGPPLITDDPGTPGDGHWEINIASQIAAESQTTIYQAPLFDINYGYGEHLQLNVVVGWNSTVQENDTTSGLSKVSSAIKWRILDEDNTGFAFSIYPRIDTLYPLSSQDPRVNNDGVRYFLPIEFSKTFGKWGINPEIGYAYNTRYPGEWNYGLAASYEFQPNRELLFEIHARCPVSRGLELLPEIGTRYAFKEEISFIGALGHTITVANDVPAFWNIYLGVQVRP